MYNYTDKNNKKINNMYSHSLSKNRRNTTVSILSNIDTEGEYIEHRSWFNWFDNFMAGAIKAVFTIGSVFVGMLKYMNDIQPKGFLTFIKIFTGPFWNIIDAVAYFFSGFAKIRHAKSSWDIFDGLFDIFVGTQLLALTIISLFILPFLAQLSFSSCMWHMTVYSFGKFVKNFSNKEESNVLNFLDFSAWLCASIGTTLLGITPFCPIAALPIVIFYALAGFFKGIQAGIQLYKWYKNKLSNDPELKTVYHGQGSPHKAQNDSHQIYKSPHPSTLFGDMNKDNKQTGIIAKETNIATENGLVNDNTSPQETNDERISDNEEKAEFK
ncbi:MAG: hypothetical protein GY821_07685 [Gammaproteobacteria bacterium]|nr:hypothetical protein [Gammaproteobacteria bacterium]